MNTKWQGLWGQERKGLYAGNVIKKSDIPKCTRLVVRYNKYYEKGGNRPRFVYCFADADGYEDKCVPLKYEESVKSKVEELADVMRQGNSNADNMCLPSTSASKAQALWERAVELIEEVTGEEWCFTWLSWD